MELQADSDKLTSTSIPAILAAFLTEIALILGYYCLGNALRGEIMQYAVLALLFLMPGFVAALTAPSGRRLRATLVLMLCLTAYYLPYSGYFVRTAIWLLPLLAAAGAGLGALTARFVDAPRFRRRALSTLTLLIAGELVYALTVLDLWLVLSRSSAWERTTDYGRPPTRFLLDPGERARGLIAIAIRQGKAGQIQEARNTLKKALRTVNEAGVQGVGSVTRQVAAADATLGLRDDAEEIMKSRIKDPIELHWELAILFLRNGDAAQAKIHALEIPDLAFKMAALRDIAKAEAKSGHAEEARKTFSTAFTFIADHGHARRGYPYARDIASSQAEAGFFDEAVATAREHCEGAEREAALASIAQIAAMAGKTSQARALFGELIAQAKQKRDRAARSRALYDIALKQADAGLVDDAESTAALIEIEATRAALARHFAMRPVKRR